MRGISAMLMLCAFLLSTSVAQAQPPLDTWSLQNPARAKTYVHDLAVGADGAIWGAGEVPLRAAYVGGTWEPIGGRAITGRNGMVAVGGTSTVVMGSGEYWTPSSQLEVSNDGGLNWRLVNAGVSFRAGRGLFINADEGWVVGSDGVVLHTTDAGASWEIQPLGTTSRIRAIDYAGGILRVAVDQYVLSSVDHGKTWTSVRVGPASGWYEISDIDFTTAQLGVAVGGMGVYRTVDGGATWQKSKTNVYYPEDEGMRVVFRNSLHGWIHGAVDDEWVTTDGGVTWDLQYTRYHYRDRYGASIKKPYIVNGWWPSGSAAGWRTDGSGGIYFSVDGGKRWYSTAVDSYTLDGIVDVSFESTTTGFLVTRPGRIWKTTDSGGSWSQSSRSPAVTTGNNSHRLTSVVKVPGGRGFAAGGSGSDLAVVFRTTSSGTSWSSTWLSGKGFLNDIWTNDGVAVWAVGEKGTILRSLNGGDSWSTRGTTAAGGASLKSVEVLPSGIGYAAGRDKVLRTTDNGSTWTSVAVPPKSDIIALDVVDDQIAWVATANFATVYRTDDGGQTWVGGTVGPSDEDGIDMGDIKAVSATEAVALREDDVWSTENGGATWQRRMSGTGVALNTVEILGDGAWVCGNSGYVYYNAHGSPEYLPPATRVGTPLGWRRQVVDLNFFAHDKDGVEETLYRLDGADSTLPSIGVTAATTGSTWSRYRTPRRVTKQGRTKVEYLSVDKRGNVERKKTRYIDIDTGKPTIRFTAKSSYRRGSVIRVKATDSVSGMKQIIVGISTADRSYQKTVKGGSASYRLKRRGTWNLDVQATDRAGNTKTYRRRIRVY